MITFIVGTFLLGCEKDEVVDTVPQVEIKLVDIKVEVQKEVLFYLYDDKEKHLDSFIVTGIYSDTREKNIIMKSEYFEVFDMTKVGESIIRIAKDGIKKEVRVEVVEGEVVFRENFDNIEDWTTASNITPKNWTRFRSGSQQWYPGNGHANHHETIEILGSNNNLAKGKKGKSMVVWRESVDKGPTVWTTDGILTKVFDKGLEEIYVEFYMCFDENFSIDNPSGVFKYFRIAHNDSKDQGEVSNFYKNGIGGYNGPIFFADYKVNDYGLQNTLAFRSDPYIDEKGIKRYFFNYGHKDNIDNYPSSMNRGDLGLNYSNHIVGMEKNGSTAKLPDRLNGGVLSTERYQFHSHEQVLGKKGQWRKLAFYLKMNSAPYVKDGVIIQWLENQRIFSNHNVAWHTYRPDGKIPSWNTVSFGGNNYFPRYDEKEKREEAYAIDDILIRKSIPEELQ